MKSLPVLLLTLLVILSFHQVHGQLFIQDINDRKILNTAFTSTNKELALNINRTFGEVGINQNATVASIGVYLPHNKKGNDFGAVFIQEDLGARRSSHFRLFYNFKIFENEDHLLRLAPELTFRHRTTQINSYDSLGRISGFQRGSGGMLNLGINLSYEFKNFFVGWSIANLLNTVPFGWPKEYFSNPDVIEMSRYQLFTVGRRFTTKPVVIEPFLTFQAGPFQFRDQYHFNLRAIVFDRLLVGTQLLSNGEFITCSLGWESIKRFNVIYEYGVATDRIGRLYEEPTHRLSFQLLRKP